jgi:two-component system cell cycle sensor histidine kinase/response regulator CckA
VGNTTRTAPSPPVRDTLHRLDGGIAQVEVGAQGFLEDGLPLVHLVIRDITERLAAEALTSELAAQLQATQRLEAVGTLAGGVAHEVNNMLQVILGFGIPLLDDRALEPQALASLSEIITAANHASGITRQLLEFSRHAEHHPQLVDLSAMVRQLMPVIRRLDGEHRRLEVSAVGSHLVWVDPGQLEQVLVNLMVNARHATADGDTIAVVASETVLATETLDIGGHPISPGRYGTLDIRDTGSGMDAATSARIFEPFFTTKPIGSGTGLGLAAVAEIMAQNGGRITVRSTPRCPRRTPFSLLMMNLPCVPSRVGCSSGPGMSGRELARHVRAQWPQVPVVFMSGYAAGAFTYDDVDEPQYQLLEKPFDPAALLSTVALVLAAVQPV